MSLQTDLENKIRTSYSIIHEYEAIIQTSGRPEEKKRSQRQIENEESPLRYL